MQVQQFIVGALSTNCYIAYSIQTKDAVIIDPGFDSAFDAMQVFRFIDAKALKVRFIVNTHGHSDHVTGNRILNEKYVVPIYVHENDVNLTRSENVNVLPDYRLLKDGGTLQFGDFSLKVMHTPGHTSGSVCLLGEMVVFTGDTLFAGGIGRTEFPESSAHSMKLSLQKLMSLPDNLAVYPGHGPKTSIGEERRSNPFLLWL